MSKKAKNKIKIKDKFYSLAPTEEAENADSYIPAIDWAIKEPDVKNIAITGNFGSGKSSILNTYKKRTKKKKRFLNISLASFNQKNYEKDESIIENSILQQILYKEKINKTPFSRFKKINNIHDKMWLKIIIIILIALSVIFLINPDIYIQIKDFIIERINYNFVFFNNWMDNILNIFIRSIIIIICIATSIYLLKCIYEIIANLSWKLTIEKDNKKLELAKQEEQDETSIFNKNIEEIIYFFEVTKYDVVIFEDIDRIENSLDLFIKLRELNILLNNSNIVNKKKITFIYALKDDVFTNSKERTKFFEFIIPIIPIVNSNNSKDKLLEMIKGQTYEKELNDDVFLNNITLYIDDMRLLRSILNEFNIYSKQIKVKYDPKKLFSIIVYKNLYPEDFAELQENKGILYAMLNKKDRKTSRIQKENMPILSYLLKNKYIDKSYVEYINYFYPTTLSIEDKNFIFNFNNNIKTRYDYQLNNIKNVLPYFKLSDFSKRDIWNFDLLYYMLKRPDKYTEQLTRMFKSLSSGEYAYRFLREYIQKRRCFTSFYLYFTKYCSKFWNRIDEDLPTKRSDQLLISILLFAEVDDIINNLGPNQNFINRINNFYSWGWIFTIEKSEREKKLLENLNIKLAKINIEQVNQKWFDLIYKNNDYEINKENIEAILVGKMNEKLEKVQTQNYTTICKYENMRKYINENIEIYLNEVFLKYPNYSNKELEKIKKLIKKEDVLGDNS